MLLGCIADDFTGATDLANTLTRQGMKAVLIIGVPQTPPDDAEAVVVALKSRTIAAEDAVAQSLVACRWLTQHGARQIYFKYCSTFDSIDKGNIGPVTEALMDELGTDVSPLCPAFPENKRTIYLGHLFVGDILLSESGMRNHPLTPMTDSNLVNVMARQSRFTVANIPYPVVKLGAQAIADAMDQKRSLGFRHLVIDALVDGDLFALGKACCDMKLLTGGSGAALGLPENFRAMGLLPRREGVPTFPTLGGSGIVLSGSCSTATLRQVEVFRQDHPCMAINIEKLFENTATEVARIANWAAANSKSQPALIYTTADSEAVKLVQKQHGVEGAGETIEQAFGELAKLLAARGVRRFVVAGGETSGAVTKALGVTSIDIGQQIAPGVPATQTRDNPRYGLVLKSGNFGGPNFFTDALAAIP